jgi:hypothetical protein
MGTCKECKHGLERCEFSYRKYGSYHCDIECCLIENEDMPYRKGADTCEKYQEKENKDGNN